MVAVTTRDMHVFHWLNFRSLPYPTNRRVRVTAIVGCHARVTFVSRFGCGPSSFDTVVAFNCALQPPVQSMRWPMSRMRRVRVLMLEGNTSRRMTKVLRVGVLHVKVARCRFNTFRKIPQSLHCFDKIHADASLVDICCCPK